MRIAGSWVDSGVPVSNGYSVKLRIALCSPDNRIVHGKDLRFHLFTVVGIDHERPLLAAGIGEQTPGWSLPGLGWTGDRFHDIRDQVLLLPRLPVIIVNFTKMAVGAGEGVVINPGGDFSQ